MRHITAQSAVEEAIEMYSKNDISRAVQDLVESVVMDKSNAWPVEKAITLMIKGDKDGAMDAMLQLNDWAAV